MNGKSGEDERKWDEGGARAKMEESKWAEAWAIGEEMVGALWGVLAKGWRSHAGQKKGMHSHVHE